jgi:putative sterol carrier protein
MNLTVLVLVAAVSVLCAQSLRASPGSRGNVVPQDVFDGMRQSFRPDQAMGVHVRYQWQLSGPHGGQWWIEVKDGKATIGKGKIDHPDVTFISSDRTWVALSNGRLSGFWATITGRLRVRGDQHLARKLGKMFP